MKKIILIAAILSLSLGQAAAKKYKFTFNPPFEIEQIRYVSGGVKFIKSWAVDKNADKAIIKAKQNAVAAALFTGIAPNRVVGASSPISPICASGPTYEENKEYFDKILVEGDFLNYALDVNSTYPTGQDNIQTPDGRRVGVYIKLLYDDLRNKLIQDNIIKPLGSQFNLNY